MAFPTALASFSRAPSLISSLPGKDLPRTARVYSISTFDVMVDAQRMKIFPFKRDLFRFVETYRSNSDVDKFRSNELE